MGFNNRFGGATPFVGKSFVFATQGSDDPWQGAGVQAPISSTYLESTANCAGCSHCRDLSASSAKDPEPLADTRAAVQKAMQGWLKA